MTSNSFQYCRLGKNQIRFVSFQPLEAEAECEASDTSTDSTLLDCYLYRGPRAMRNVLVALSYVWGSREHTERVRMNGYEIVIQANLWAALAAIRKQRPTVLLWIDALCINQGDKLEKSREVGRMGGVYSNAKEVIAWLGPPDGSGDEVMKKRGKVAGDLRSLTPYKESMLTDIPGAFENKIGWLMSKDSRQRDLGKGTWINYFAHFKVSDDAEGHLPKTALKVWFGRPFWHRVWIV